MLTGSSRNDAINGNEGADVLTGGRGRDELIGGTGNDTFQFVHTTDTLKGHPDLIDDFSHSEGDRIDLHNIDANTKIAGNQAFHSSAHRTSTTRPANCTLSVPAPADLSRATSTATAKPTSRSSWTLSSTAC